MDGVHEGADVIDRGVGQDAVAQVEDVARSAAGAGEDQRGATANLGRGCQQRGGIEVPLHGHSGAEPRTIARAISE